MTPEEIQKIIDERITAQMDEIVERVVKRVFSQMYEEVGKSVVRKALWVIGVGVMVLLTFLVGKGYLKP